MRNTDEKSAIYLYVSLNGKRRLNTHQKDIYVLFLQKKGAKFTKHAN